MNIENIYISKWKLYTTLETKDFKSAIIISENLINFLMFGISPIINCGITIKQQQLSVAENGEVGDEMLH